MVERLRLPVRLASRVIRGGGLVAFPTEGLWGIGCEPLNAHACWRLIGLKRRDPGKGLIVLASEVDALLPLVDAGARDDVAAVLAGFAGTTWVVPASEHAPPWLTGGRGTVAVRLSTHALAGALCRAVGGPLVSTSANHSDRTPARSALQVRRRFGRTVDMVLDGTAGGTPTPIRRYPDGERLR